MGNQVRVGYTALKNRLLEQTRGVWIYQWGKLAERREIKGVSLTCFTYQVSIFSYRPSQ